ncbi:MAG: LysE family transporter [Desulfuromonadaceae bacterium]|nr:LysE family transporter [Desulfuromonadaceae bacterium]MDD5106961.1 LysE family transporter [Desulfuromonadaceae bacterium]
MQLSEWLTVLVIGWFVVITPGPNMAIVIRNSLIHSRSAGVYTAGGLAFGNLIHITYCLVGIGLLISKSILLFNIVKWLGAGYLIYLGIKSLRAQPHLSFIQADISPSFTGLSALRTGILTDLLNPKATLFFLALFTQIIRPGTPLLAQIVYGTTIVVLEFGCFAILAVIIGHHTVRQRVEAVSHWIERVTGIVLIVLGVRVAFSTSTR